MVGTARPGRGEPRRKIPVGNVAVADRDRHLILE